VKIADKHDFHLNWLNGQKVRKLPPGKVIPIHKRYLFVQISNAVVQYNSQLLKSWGPRASGTCRLNMNPSMNHYADSVSKKEVLHNLENSAVSLLYKADLFCYFVREFCGMINIL
jgi:hypothetical protein